MTPSQGERFRSAFSLDSMLKPWMVTTSFCVASPTESAMALSRFP